MLYNKIINRKSGILLYGLTPPKQEYSPEKTAEIAQKQISRIENQNIDGLILYDIQDESGRTELERPFPFFSTIDPQLYSTNFLASIKKPHIIYNCVGKYSEIDFIHWLQHKNNHGHRYSVFVGAASKNKAVTISIKEAYYLKKMHNEALVLGGITIAERHLKKDDEHIRVFDKINSGCQFFVSQAVYNVDASKNLISDIYYHSVNNESNMVPLIFTLTPCGSLKTLAFMEWLGISIPKWLKNDLKSSGNILNKSMDICYLIAEELVNFCSEKHIPIGFNIESVAIRKAEIDSSIELLNKVNKLLVHHFEK